MVALAAWCDRAGWFIIGAGFVLCVVSTLVTVRGLGFATDRNDLIGTQEAYRKTYDVFRKEFPQEDDIVIVVTSPDPGLNRKVVDRVGALLRQDPAHFSDVYDRLSLEFIRRRLLLYLSISDLRELEKRLVDVKPFLKKLMSDPGLVPLFGSINDEIQAYIKEQINAALEGGGVPSSRDRADAPDMVGSLPILAGILKDMAGCVRGPFKYRSPWAEMFSASKSNEAMQEIPEDIYLEFQDGSMYLVVFKPVKDKASFNPAEEVLGRLRALVAQVRREFPTVQMGTTGEPVLENDEMEASSKDSEFASIVSLFLIALLFAFTFGNLGRPLLGMICLVLAMGWTMGFATVAIGHLNILTVTCMPMLIGLGIDFGIQVISRYDEEMLGNDPRGAGEVTPSGVCVQTEPRAAMQAALRGTGLSIITAALTTAVSFGAAWFTGFRGVGELGLLAGGGLMLSLLAMIVVLPAMLLIADRRRLRRVGHVLIHPSPLGGLARVERGFLHHPWAVLVVGLAFTVFCGFQAGKVTFDYNLLNLQSKGVESVEWEYRLISGSSREVLFAAVVAHDVVQARDLEKRLAALPTVKSVESVAPMFPEHQEAKLKLIPKIQRALSDVPPLKEPLPPVDASRLVQIVGDLRGIFFLIYPEVRQAGEMTIASHVRHFIFSADQLLGRVGSQERGLSEKRLLQYQSDFFHDLGDKLALIRGQGLLEPLTLDTMPPLLRRTRMGVSGSFLLQVFPKEKIWDQEPLQRFLEDIDKVAPSTRPEYAGPRFAYSTGTPVMMYNSTRLLVQSYIDAGWYAFAAIALCVLLHFRSLLASFLALVPLGIGMVWMEGIQGLFHIPFNPANYMVLPLILGIGVANGIYVVRRFQEEGHARVFEVSTGRAILLSNLTSMIGFGSLMIAKYQGIFTLGKVMTLGIGTCMTAALVLLPVILQLLARLRVRV